MDNKKTLLPCILLDFKKHRIRIHQTGVSQLGNPQYVLLLINPVSKTIGVVPSDGKTPFAYRIDPRKFIKRNSVELYSHALLQEILRIQSSWTENNKYRIFGSFLPNKNMIEFRMDAALPVSEDAYDD